MIYSSWPKIQFFCRAAKWILVHLIGIKIYTSTSFKDYLPAIRLSHFMMKEMK